jgi:hypothetical protein
VSDDDTPLLTSCLPEAFHLVALIWIFLLIPLKWPPRSRTYFICISLSSLTRHASEGRGIVNG